MSSEVSSVALKYTPSDPSIYAALRPEEVDSDQDDMQGANHNHTSLT